MLGGRVRHGAGYRGPSDKFGPDMMVTELIALQAALSDWASFGSTYGGQPKE
jgi:hypothetical protein